MSRRGWALFLLLGVVWGLPYLLIRISVREVSPALLVFTRTGGGALLLLPVAAARGELGAVARRWRAILVYSCVEIAVPWYFLFAAERRLTSSLAGLLVAAVPLVGAAIALSTGTDRLDRRRAAGLLVGMAGVGALVGFDVRGSSVTAALSLGLVAVGYALGPWILARHLSGLPGIGVVAASLTVCAVLYAVPAALTLPTRPLAASVVTSMALLTVLCTVVAFVAFFALVREVGAMRTTIITYVNPAVAVVLGIGVLGEPFSVATGIGFALVLAGSYLATRPIGTARTPAGEPDDGSSVPVVAEP